MPIEEGQTDSPFQTQYDLIAKTTVVIYVIKKQNFVIHTCIFKHTNVILFCCSAKWFTASEGDCP